LQIAPVAVSDAAMLAPEEVFKGKGDIKEDTELTQADRKRRRANKKRKFKGIFIHYISPKIFDLGSLFILCPRGLCSFLHQFHHFTSLSILFASLGNVEDFSSIA